MTVSRTHVDAFAPVVVYAGVIFALSMIPGSHVPQLFTWNGADKLEHMVLYGLFGLLVARALRVLWPRLPAVACVLLVAYLALLYGTADEVHQLFTPGRSCDPFDAMADTSGATLGALLYLAPRIFRQVARRLVPPADGAGA